jgi:hypothetical protein
MRTQQHTNKSHSSKAAYNPHLATIGSVRANLPRFKIVKAYEGFHLNQVVYQYQGPTYGVEGPGEVPVTVAPNQGPFVGLPPDYLERVSA